MSDDSGSDRDDGPAGDSDDRDPFDSFDEPRGRAGGPLDGDDDAGRGPFEYGNGRDRDEADRGAGGTDRSPGPARTDAGDPLADVEVPDGDPFESNASAFERSGVDSLDPDDVWARLTGPGDTESRSDSESWPDATGETGAAEAPPPAGEDDVAEVSKHGYCEGCEHFSPPPDVTCSYEDTEILEFVDVDTVRVANCPVVAERRELEDGA